MLLSESRNEIWGLDEIQFTRNLDHGLQIAQMEQFSQQSLLSKSNIVQVSIAFDSEIFCLMPKDYFKPAQSRDLLEWIGEVGAQTEVMHDSIPNQDFVLIHGLPGGWKNWAEQLFESSETHWMSGVSGLLNQASKRSVQTGEALLMAHIESNYLYLIAAQNGIVSYANRFAYQSENDLLYFVLLALQESNMNPMESRVILSGSILPGSLGFEKLARYVLELEFAKSNSELQIPAGFEIVKHHHYFDLLSIPSLF